MQAATAVRSATFLGGKPLAARPKAAARRVAFK